MQIFIDEILHCINYERSEEKTMLSPHFFRIQLARTSVISEGILYFGNFGSI